MPNSTKGSNKAHTDEEYDHGGQIAPLGQWLDDIASYLPSQSYVNFVLYEHVITSNNIYPAAQLAPQAANESLLSNNEAPTLNRGPETPDIHKPKNAKLAPIHKL